MSLFCKCRGEAAFLNTMTVATDESNDENNPDKSKDENV